MRAGSRDPVLLAACSARALASYSSCCAASAGLWALALFALPLPLGLGLALPLPVAVPVAVAEIDRLLPPLMLSPPASPVLPPLLLVADTLALGVAWGMTVSWGRVLRSPPLFFLLLKRQDEEDGVGSATALAEPEPEDKEEDEEGTGIRRFGSPSARDLGLLLLVVDGAMGWRACRRPI